MNKEFSKPDAENMKQESPYLPKKSKDSTEFSKIDLTTMNNSDKELTNKISLFQNLESSKTNSKNMKTTFLSWDKKSRTGNRGIQKYYKIYWIILYSKFIIIC